MARFAQENDLAFLETSALTGENVEEAFIMAVRTVLVHVDSGVLNIVLYLIFLTSGIGCSTFNSDLGYGFINLCPFP